VKTLNGNDVICHPIIGNITSDLVELKELVSILQGSNPFRPCPKCNVQRTELRENKKFKRSELVDTKERRKQVVRIKKEIMKCQHLKMMKKRKDLREASVNILRTYSIMEVQSYFETSLLCPLTKHIDLYKILAFEPMHNLFLGISKTIKVLIYFRLGSEILEVQGTGDKTKKFKTIRCSILKCINEMLSRMENESYIPDFVVDFSSKSNPTDLNGLYSKDGLIGMMEAKNYKCLDTIFPFVASFIDRCCGELSGPLTTICSLYNDIVQCTIHRDCSPPWTSLSVQKLRKMILTFKTFMVQIFQDYHPSGLRTVKFHMLNHLDENIESFGDMRMVDVQFYENRHLTFKQEFNRT